MNQDEYLRVGKAAEELEVGVKTLSRWIRAGLVAHKRTIGGGVGPGHARIPRSEVDRLKQRMEQGLRPVVSRPDPETPTRVVVGSVNGSGRAGSPPARPEP